jgi:Plant transposon protein
MGNTTSSNGKPPSLLRCVDKDGKIDPDKYFLSRRLLNDDIQQAPVVAIATREIQPRHRSCKKKENDRVLDDGTIRPGSPLHSIWYVSYIGTANIDDNDFQKEFRLRFRVPYTCFQELCRLATSHKMFEKYSNKDCTGSSPTPIELHILGVLRILGRDHKLDDIAECTCIARETHRQFFHLFMRFASTILYSKYVKMPTTKEELLPHMQMYACKGFHGAVGSMDATHISSKRMPYALWQLHKGHKMKLPARSYNITVNNNRKILYSTTGAPGRWNDMTVVEFDEFYKGIKSHEIGDDVEFELYYYDQTSQKVKKQKYCGVWLIVDNGYHSVSCTIPPFKDPPYTDQYMWSEWLESTRKDVECTFGIMKTRWLIFESPIRYQGIEIIDRIWRCACALHNMILEYDDNQDDGNHVTKNFLLLPDPETSGMHYTTTNPEDFSDDTEHEDVSYLNGCGRTIPVKMLTMKNFRSRLVRHYAICKANGLANWKPKE